MSSSPRLVTSADVHSVESEVAGIQDRLKRMMEYVSFKSSTARARMRQNLESHRLHHGFNGSQGGGSGSGQLVAGSPVHGGSSHLDFGAWYSQELQRIAAKAGKLKAPSLDGAAVLQDGADHSSSSVLPAATVLQLLRSPLRKAGASRNTEGSPPKGASPQFPTLPTVDVDFSYTSGLHRHRSLEQMIALKSLLYSHALSKATVALTFQGAQTLLKQNSEMPKELNSTSSVVRMRVRQQAEESRSSTQSQSKEISVHLRLTGGSSPLRNSECVQLTVAKLTQTLFSRVQNV